MFLLEGFSSELKECAAQLSLTQVAYQVYGLCVDALQTAAPLHVPAVLQDANLSLQRSAQALYLQSHARLSRLDFRTQYCFMAGYSRASPPPFCMADRTACCRL